MITGLGETMNESIIVGRVLRSSTTSFTVGCRQLISEQDQRIPEFGTLVRAEIKSGAHAYGLIYNVTIEDDTFVRQLVAAGVESAEIIEDQRQKRQVPVVVDVLVVGGGQGLEVAHRLPAQPPARSTRSTSATPPKSCASPRGTTGCAPSWAPSKRPPINFWSPPCATPPGPPAGSAGRLPDRRGPRAGEAAGARSDAVGWDFETVA